VGRLWRSQGDAPKIFSRVSLAARLLIKNGDNSASSDRVRWWGRPMNGRRPARVSSNRASNRGIAWRQPRHDCDGNTLRRSQVPLLSKPKIAVHIATPPTGANRPPDVCVSGAMTGRHREGLRRPVEIRWMWHERTQSPTRRSINARQRLLRKQREFDQQRDAEQIERQAVLDRVARADAEMRRSHHDRPPSKKYR
jgi:hypothetical protein